MKKTLLLIAAFFPLCILTAQSFVRDFYAEGLEAYYAGNLKKAKELLSGLDPQDASKPRMADFILATIAASEGDLQTAKIRFPRAFENPPENTLNALLENFTNFADANRLYGLEVEILKPFYEKRPEDFEKNSMAMYRYARALLETGQKDAAAETVKRVWDIFSGSASADACDMLLYDGDLKSLAIKGLKAALSPLSIARMNALKGNLDAFELPENPGLGLAVWAFENGKASHEDLENALEESPNSQFAWNAWYILGVKAFEDGLYELANGFAEKALSLSPDDIAVTWNIRALNGDSLRFLKKQAEAREEYKKVYMSGAVPGEAVAECIYKAGLSYYEEEKWNSAYVCFERVFVGYNAFDYWSSRAYYYAAKTRLEKGDNIGARNVLREYIKYSKHRDTDMFRNAEALFTNIKIR